MIESNIINWIELGDSLQNLDIYGKKKISKFFELMRKMMSLSQFSIFFFIILKLFFFLQLLMLTLVTTESEEDSTVKIGKYISTVLFVQEIITDAETYKIAVIINSVLTLLTIISFIYLIISVKIEKFYLKLPIHFLNLVNVIGLNYLIGPIVQIGIMSTNCPDGVHKFLKVQCYSDLTHIFLFLASIVNLIFFVMFSIILSIYFNEIGSINDTKVLSRINCNYEIYMNIGKIFAFSLAYIMKYYGNGEKLYDIILQAYLFLNSFIFSIYVYKTVFFYDKRINVVTLYGWVFVCWFTFIILIKTLLNIVDTTLFHGLGWLILGFILYFIQEFREEYLLTDFNIFEAKTLKEIELFNNTLFLGMNQRSLKSKTMLTGIIQKFDEIVKNNPDGNDKYARLLDNPHLKKKFNSNCALPLLSIMYIIYDHHGDKSAIKNDILLTMSYFLMNKLKNVTFTIYLLSKIKVTNHKQGYFKFVGMEEIKEYLINKGSKSNSKESIKHVQLGSVILYNIYIDLFKLKIYDAACNQIDYFDVLKNNVTTAKTTENFLKIGEDILNGRKEILQLWGKIIEGNPFSDESEKDYMLYGETIGEDDILARTESKKYSTGKTNKLSERNNIYHSMFIKELSSVVLIDGYGLNGKILYTSPNFPGLFSFSGKEILNMSMDDLIPNVIAGFHKDLVDNAIKYSNLHYIFNSQKDMLLKGKTGGIFNIKLYVKCAPNLTYGLIYMTHITKLQDHHFIIVLDKDYRINGLTDMMAQGGMNYTMNNNYGGTQNLIGHHIALVLPEIGLQMEYRDQKFVIPKSDIDLKGNLYPVNAWKELDIKIESVLERIKQCGKLENEDEQKRDTIQEYEELIKDISTKYAKPFSVFYKIATKSFLDGKEKYHRIYITNDLIALNENSHAYPSVGKSGSGGSVKKKHDSKGTSLPELKDSVKQIKGKVGDQSENKGLLDGEKKENDGMQDKENNDNNMNNNKKTIGPLQSSAPSSVLTKSSIDSASFNKLKNGILEKKEVTSIKIMKYLCFVFGVLSIVFIVLNSLQIQNNFDNLSAYLDQNIYFNHSKISVANLYVSGGNGKWIRDNITEDPCMNHECRNFYTELLQICFNDIKEQKENSSYFYNDFKKILGLSKNIELFVYSGSKTDKITIDVDNGLNFLISNGLKLVVNIEEYMGYESSIYLVNSQNMLAQSLNYFYDLEISGFGNEEKEQNISSQFTPIPYYLIVDCFKFVLLVFTFGWLIFKLNDGERYYLEKLISFRSVNFENYLKRLDDLKKKLRNDNGEDEDKLNGEMDMNELNSKKDSKKEDDSSKGKKKGKKTKDDDKEEKDDGKGGNKKKIRKKGINKQSKIQQQRNEKKKIMERYFLRKNLFFTLKVMGILIVGFTYYVVIMGIEVSKKSDYLSFDSTTNEIEGVYKASFDNFLLLKTELANLENILIDFKNETYKMKIPANSELHSPKLGNLLMPLVNNVGKSTDSRNELNNGYNGDACKVGFSSNNTEYETCSKFWSSIGVKGMEQSITQMSVILNTVLDELNSLNAKDQEVKEALQALSKESSFRQYEYFVEYYLFLSYMKTVSIFTVGKAEKVKSINNIFQAILIGYTIGVVVLFFILLLFVYSSKYVFNSFLNFIGIGPVKYGGEDESGYKDILKLEQNIF